MARHDDLDFGTVWQLGQRFINADAIQTFHADNHGFAFERGGTIQVMFKQMAGEVSQAVIGARGSG